jgi:hypothetical protein
VAKPIKVQLAQGDVKPSNEVVLGVVLEFGEAKFKENFTKCELNNIEAILGTSFRMPIELEASYHMSLELELGMIKCLFPYTHASKTQEFNHKL